LQHFRKLHNYLLFKANLKKFAKNIEKKSKMLIFLACKSTSNFLLLHKYRPASDKKEVM